MDNKEYIEVKANDIAHTLPRMIELILGPQRQAFRFLAQNNVQEVLSAEHLALFVLHIKNSYTIDASAFIQERLDWRLGQLTHDLAFELARQLVARENVSTETIVQPLQDPAVREIREHIEDNWLKSFTLDDAEHKSFLPRPWMDLLTSRRIREFENWLLAIYKIDNNALTPGYSSLRHMANMSKHSQTPATLDGFLNYLAFNIYTHTKKPKSVKDILEETKIALAKSLNVNPDRCELEFKVKL